MFNHDTVLATLRIHFRNTALHPRSCTTPNPHVRVLYADYISLVQTNQKIESLNEFDFQGSGN